MRRSLVKRKSSRQSSSLQPLGASPSLELAAAPARKLAIAWSISVVSAGIVISQPTSTYRAPAIAVPACRARQYTCAIARPRLRDTAGRHEQLPHARGVLPPRDHSSPFWTASRQRRGDAKSFVVHTSLPALTRPSVHDLALNYRLTLPALMPWIMFGLGCAFFWLLGRALSFPPATTGGLMLTGGLANTSFVGLPMI